MIDRLSFRIMGLKDLKINFIADSAFELFISKSIFDVTIKDIAEKAEVGEATIYRYFGKKQNIVLHIVMKLQNEVKEKYFNLDAGKTGFDKLSIFFNSYLNIFKEKISYFGFIREFDAYMAEGDNSKSLAQYEEAVDSFNNIFEQAYQLGLQDGSVKEVDNISLFYYSSTHALLELCKKLSVNHGLLNQDNTIEKSLEIEYLIGIFLKMLKNS